ncbi:hypothetical protein ACFL09_06115 [Planctomycetota bacterium]
MDSGKAALILFYAFFWALAMNAASRYRIFDTARALRLLPDAIRSAVRRICQWAGCSCVADKADATRRKRRFEDRRAVRRLFWGFLLLNLFPILWLCILHAWVVSEGRAPLDVLGAAVASLSVFGFHRLLHGWFAPRHHLFYTHKQWEELMAAKTEFPHVPQSWPHLVAGVAYLLILGLALPTLIGWLPKIIGWLRSLAA